MACFRGWTMGAMLVFAVILIIVSGSCLGWLGLRDRLPSEAFKARMKARQDLMERNRIARQTRSTRDPGRETSPAPQASPSAER